MRAVEVLSILALGATAYALKGGDIIENRYVVEFDMSKAPEDGVGKREELHTHFYNHLKARDVPFELHHEYKMDWYSGASVTIRDPTQFEHLGGFHAVERVWPVTYVEGPQPVARSQLDEMLKQSMPLPEQRSVEESRAEEQQTGERLAARQLSQYPNGYGTGNDFGPLSQIPLVQAADIRQTTRGAGVTIGIVDSGVDYNRPEMGGGIGPGKKVTGGTNYLVPAGSTGTVTDQRGTVQNRNDPLDTCNGHGTFVGHMAAAASGDAANPYKVPGIASDANMRHYKIFDCNSGAGDDTILAAITQAAQDGCKVINLSLGSASGWTFGQGNMNVAKFVAQGLHIIVAAGNEGRTGFFYTSNPAGGGGLTVGASSGATEPYVLGQLKVGSSNSGTPIRFSLDSGIYTGTYKIYATTGNVCTGVGQTFAAGDRVLVFAASSSTPTCKDKTQAYQVAEANGAGLVTYTSTDAPERKRATSYITYGSLGNSGDASRIQALYNSNPSNAYITFPDAGVMPQFDAVRAFGQPTSFTTRGPTFDLSILPHVTAPGDNLFASYPAALGGYSVGQGTSYAAPIAAGAVAIMVQRNASIAPIEVRERLQMTAKWFPRLGAAANSIPDSVAVQGAGQIQLADAINTNTYIGPTMVMLNDTNYPQYTKYIVITNYASSQLTYTLGHTPASTVYTYGTDGQPASSPEYLDSQVATVKFSRTSVTLAAKQRALLLYTVTPPAGLSASRLPIYSGFITVTGGSVPLHQSYVGVGARMIDIPAINSALPPKLVNVQGNQLTSGTYSWCGSGNDLGWCTEPPLLQFKLKTGSPKINIDVVDSGSTFTPTYSRRDVAPRDDEGEGEGGDDDEHDVDENSYEGVLEADGEVALPPGWTKYFGRRTVSPRAASSTKANICSLKPPPAGCSTNSPAGPGDTYSQTVVAGMANVFTYRPRNSGNEDGDGTDKTTVTVSVPVDPSNGQPVSGQFRFLLRVLRVSGNPIVANDYDSYLSPTVTIQQAK